LQNRVELLRKGTRDIPLSRSVTQALSTGFVLLMVFPWAAGISQPKIVPPSRILVEGEELTYNVRYSFINLGQVRIRTLQKVASEPSTSYLSRAFIDSYSGVPFVDLHAVFESVMDSTIFSRKFMGKVKDGKVWDFARYTFEYDQNRVLIETGRRDTIVEKRDTAAITTHTNDGLSIFFFARDRLFSRKKINVPTFIREKKVNTYLDFHGENTTADIDAVDYPVDVIGFDGTAEFVGIFGLTGDFEGWFSNDEARVPIKAKMKVIIGSITIELMEWKRPGWQPPRGR
jgi:hypothetical protein